MKRTAKGTVLIALGVLLLLGALGWYGYNCHTEHRAGESAARLLQQLE